MSISISIFNAGTLQPGGVLEGKVICVMKKQKKIRGIRLKVIGHEHTSWEETESAYDIIAKAPRLKIVEYSGDNEFLAIQETLRGGGLIQLGRHEFPFRFVLPKYIPSTYNGKHGHIRYYLKANVDIPMAFDYKDEKNFIVDEPIDFNQMNSLLGLKPVQYQDETNLCCCWCASDPITLDVYLEKEAFVIGEVIKMKVHMLNMSNKSLDGLRVELIREITEKCTSPKTDEKKETEIVASARDTNGVGANGDRDYILKLRIPSGYELPNLTSSQLFSQRFKIKVEAVIPGCHLNMKIEMPVKIGHIPVTTQRATNTISPTAPVRPASQSQSRTNSAPPNPGVPGKNLPRVHGTPKLNPPGAPCPQGAPSLPTRSSNSHPVANAPTDKSAPSAPS